MKRVLMGITLSMLMVAGTGCNLLDKRCNSCSGNLGCRPCSVGWQRGGTDYQRFLGNSQAPAGAHGAGGAPAAQVAYPYYTTRGPRDFLASNPPSIGN